MIDGALAGKGIVVVGGTSGLGLAGALACVRAGARVVVVGRSAASVERAADELGPAGLAIAADACSPETAEGAIRAAVERFGSADGLYHVAGGSGRSMGDGALHEITDEGWQFTVDLNLSSVVWSNRAMVRHFLERGRGGSIVNMSSVLARRPSPRYFSTHAYAATKAAIEGLTIAGAARYASDGIRMNALAPAVVATSMAERALSDPAIRAFLRTKQPLCEDGVGRPDDADAAVVFLLSDAARRVTGQVLAIDGAWSISDGQISEALES